MEKSSQAVQGSTLSSHHTPVMLPHTWESSQAP